MSKVTDSSAMLGRAFNILTFVTTSERSVTVPEVIDAVQLPRPTVHRICNTLESMGLLSRDLARNRLIAGPTLRKMALDTLASTEIALPRRAILRSTVKKVLETVTLTVLEHDEILFLDRVESDSPLRLQLFAGSRAPLHCTSAGKLFMAMQSAERRKRWLAAYTLTQFTEFTITDPESLEVELKRIRAEKVSVDNQEYIEGMVGIAVPILDGRGKTIAAVSVNGPSSRMCLDDRDRYVLPLRKAAEELSLCLSQSEEPS